MVELIYDVVNAAFFEWMWGEDELPIVDHWTYLLWRSQRTTLGMHTWRMQLERVKQYQVGKMDAILPDPRLDSRFKICFLINVVFPKFEHVGEAWEGNAKFVNQLETVQITAANKMLGCSSTTSNRVFGEYLETTHLKEIREVRKLKYELEYGIRLPAAVDGNV